MVGKHSAHCALLRPPPSWAAPPPPNANPCTQAASRTAGAARPPARATTTSPELISTYRQAHAARARLCVDASAAVAAHELALEVGIWKAALALAVQVGVERAAGQLDTTTRTLYRAWDRWGWGGPSERPEAVQRVHEARVAANRGRTVPADHPWKWASRVAAAERTAKQVRRERELAGMER